MAKKKAILELGVDYGNISIGDKTARVGVTVGRKALSLTQADKTICERRLSGQILAKPAGWEPDQQGLGFEDDQTLDGVFDVKGVSFTGDHLTFGLTFSVKDIDVATLAQFAKRAGRLSVYESAVLPEGETNGDGEE